MQFSSTIFKNIPFFYIAFVLIAQLDCLCNRVGVYFMEVYKKIQDFDNYSISTLGNLLSNNNYKGRKPKILKPILQPDGYLHFTLCRETIKYQLIAHRLVALAFIPNPENKPHINHINGIKNDNRVENLEWVTKSENTKHAFKIGLMKSPKYFQGKMGKLHPNSKKVKVSLHDGTFIGIFHGTREVYRELKISQPYVSTCCRGISRHTKYNLTYI